MKTNAYKTNRTFYKNTGFEKRANNHGPAARFNKDPHKDRLFITPSMSGNSATQDAAVASVMKLFKGMFVSLDAGTVQWDCRELFP